MLIFFGFAVIILWQMKRDGKRYAVLLPLRELRGDIMLFLVDNALIKKGALSCEEYKSIQKLYAVVDFTVNGYDRHTTEMFNLHKLHEQMKNYRHTRDRAPYEPTDHPKIREFHARFRYLFAIAFIAYTPFVRTLALLGFVVLTLGIGGAKLRELLKSVRQQVADARDDERRYGVGDEGASVAL